MSDESKQTATWYKLQRPTIKFFYHLCKYISIIYMCVCVSVFTYVLQNVIMLKRQAYHTQHEQSSGIFSVPEV